MAKFLDKSMEEWEEMVDEWHNDDSINLTLPEYMGLDEIEFLRFAHNITEPNLSEEEIKEEASKRGRQAMVGLTLMEMFNA